MRLRGRLEAQQYRYCVAAQECQRKDECQTDGAKSDAHEREPPDGVPLSRLNGIVDNFGEEFPDLTGRIEIHIAPDARPIVSAILYLIEEKLPGMFIGKVAFEHHLAAIIGGEVF